MQLSCGNRFEKLIERIKLICWNRLSKEILPPIIPKGEKGFPANYTLQNSGNESNGKATARGGRALYANIIKGGAPGRS